MEERMTARELYRLELRIWKRITRNGSTVWDWPTLRICHPQLASVLKAIRLLRELRGFDVVA